MKNLLKLTLTLCLAVFITNLVFGQESMMVSTNNNPGFYEILSPGELEDVDLERFCYKLNKKANMANFFDSNTLIKFDNGVEILFFKTYKELTDFTAILKRDATHTLRPSFTVTADKLPKALRTILTLEINN